jgi:ketosteroid isomerase-like protein
VPAESRATNASEASRIEAVLDDFHAAAAAADEERYFARLTSNAVFLGTAGDERWVGDEYRALVHSFFSKGKGWTYIPSERTVFIAEDGGSAWFDERLESNWCKNCRGTGVLQRQGESWKIAQYSLSIPVPNDVVDEIVATIETG